MAGLIDWEAIVDRTRNLKANSHWDSPGDIVSACARQFQHDKWAKQPRRAEVWIEKDALAGVFADVCGRLDVPYFSCRGYTSQSEMWVAARRIEEYIKAGQSVVIFHFGDHDPSGIDMSRDIKDRLNTFVVGDLGQKIKDAPEEATVKEWFKMFEEKWGLAGRPLEVKRVALNRDQIEEYNPPPNPAKATDARFAAYQREHGDESWELDALNPTTLAGLVEENVLSVRDGALWEEAEEREGEARRKLGAAASDWDSLTGSL
jgi:hypothetical protein